MRIIPYMCIAVYVLVSITQQKVFESVSFMKSCTPITLVGGMWAGSPGQQPVR